MEIVVGSICPEQPQDNTHTEQQWVRQAILKGKINNKSAHWWTVLIFKLMLENTHLLGRR